MITRDTIDEIQRLKERRYTQDRVAKELKISRSTVARYWSGGKELSRGKTAPRKWGFEDVFVIRECPDCGLIYPCPKFMPVWFCPGCKRQNRWENCCY